MDNIIYIYIFLPFKVNILKLFNSCADVSPVCANGHYISTIELLSSHNVQMSNLFIQIENRDKSGCVSSVVLACHLSFT